MLTVLAIALLVIAGIAFVLALAGPSGWEKE